MAFEALPEATQGHEQQEITTSSSRFFYGFTSLGDRTDR
jgi:hypothetical protein